MQDKSIPQPIRQSIVEPISFPDEEELCRRLDEFYRASGIKPDVSPSLIFQGALYAMRREYSKENHDWMSQVAHSLREILYQFDRGNKKRNLAFEQYGSTYDEKKRIQDVGRYYNFITNIAHHNITEAATNSLIGGSKDKPITITREVFENVVFQFGKILYAVLRRQLDAHREIDGILEQNPENTSVKDKIESLINLNPDARQYLFAKADEGWLKWLLDNGFLDAIKQKADAPTRYSYRMPELNYLARMAEKKPQQVANIILTVSISKETFNPEVIDQFSRICGALPAEQLSRIVSKIRNDGWVQLMDSFKIWGFEYEKMFQTLASAKNYKQVLTLAETVLAVRTKDEIKQTSRGFSSDNLFYFSDLSYTKVFKHLISINDEYVERALELATKVIAKIILLGDRAESIEVFPVRDIFPLFDVDFFSLAPSDKEDYLDQENFRELAATIKELVQRVIEKKCHEPESARAIYRKYIQTLPESGSMWRLRLFVLSLCPSAFQEGLKQSFSRLFDVMESGKSYYEIESGTEYKKTLKKSFGVLDGDYKREYVKNVFKYFGRNFEDQNKEQWHKRDGWQILSVICEYLTEAEYEDCEKIFGKKCDSAFEPDPSIREMQMGWVVPRGPTTQEEFGKLSIAEIARKLQGEWTPKALQKQNTSNDFLNPLNARGVGELLRADIIKRLYDYVQNACLFFEGDVLDQHYTYSFLRGIQEAIRANKSGAVDLNWDELIKLIITIKMSGEIKAFEHEARERDNFDMWLSGWTGVHSAMTDVLHELLNEHDSKISIDFSKYRDRIFGIIYYLLAYPDPEPKDEELKTATMKMQSPGDKEYLVSDPFTRAINTVRGKAFQSFVLFIYQDGKKFSEEGKIKISSDVKELYETVLKKEKTRALMFMFGHYLPSFYFRDKEWMHKLLAQIFPEESEKKHLYLAAWEGYLANNLYEEIFFDAVFQKLYERGLAVTGQEDSKRKYFREPDEGIANHLSLVFIFHYKKFGFEHPLFLEFWNKNVERQAKFVSFIGRMFVSGDNAQANEFLKKEPESRERLLKFWQWLLENYDEPKLFTEFGFWINLRKNIFEYSWLAQKVKETLEKTNGVLDWDSGLTKSILELAKTSPKDTFEIARLYLLEGGVRGGIMRMPFSADNEWFEALKVLYSNSETKDGTFALINDLIREGGSMFWKLKEIIQSAPSKLPG